MEEPRVVAFRTLRGPCVELSQISLKHKAKKASGQDVIRALEAVHSSLGQIAKTSNSLDPKLADYVFFPLSHIFRDVKELPTRAVEIALQCLRILICQGWKHHLPVQMGKQLLILLCFIAGGNAGEGKVKAVQEELGTAAFDCLSTIFSISHIAGLSGHSGLVSTENVPLLGHTVTVLLDGISKGTIPVRLSAFSALKNLIEGIEDREALRSVVPGTVSSVTKVLSSNSTERPSSENLVQGIDVMKAILVKVIADGHEQGPIREAQLSTNGAVASEKSHQWVEATAGQVRMALANIMPLRYHEKGKVRKALSQLCTALIQHCRTPLSQAMPMLVETLVVLCTESSGNTDAAMHETESVLAVDMTLLEMLMDSTHDWIVAMPRIMQSNDDGRKVRFIDQVSMAFRILESQGMNLDILNDVMVTNLQSSIGAAIQANSSRNIASAPEDSLAVAQRLHSNAGTSGLPTFGPVLLQASNAGSSMLEGLARQLQNLSLPTKLQRGVAKTLRTTPEDQQLASLWLSLQMVSTSLTDNDITSQYLDLPVVSEAHEPLLDDIYAFSLEVLSKSTFEDSDRWKLQALCLEIVALQARHQKADFRPELVDSLYPILERLGSSNAALQSHALTCLSIVSTSCQYPAPAAMIIDNADYLVNAISLKLNTFDISPQAPQVLVMMITLCGSSLIPYLDDLVDSIFSILACYHGYPKLVESLFSVLSAIVDQAAKANDKAIDYRPDGITKPHYPPPPSIDDVLNFLRTRREKHPPSSEVLDPNPPPPPEADPSSASTSPPPPPPPRASTPAPPAPSKTTTLIHAITSLTPSHLTSPSPTLRSNLLSLLSTALPILAADADTILPLAATLFPLISTRLFSAITTTTPSLASTSSPPPKATPPHETLAATNAMLTLCHCSGDFLFSRINHSSWWTNLRKLYRWAEDGMTEERRMMGRRRGGMKWRVWDGVVELLLGVVRDVGVGDGEGVGEKGVFEMLRPWVVEGGGGREGGKLGRVVKMGVDVKEDWGGAMEEGRRREVREVLGMLNPDVLWLVEERARVRGGGKGMEKPDGVEGREFKDLQL